MGLFKSANDMLVKITFECTDFYNVETGDYVFCYNEDGSICVYTLGANDASAIAEQAKRQGECWSAFLGWGGDIYDSALWYAQEKFEAEGLEGKCDFETWYIDNADSIDDEALAWCEKNWNSGDWVSTDDYV